MLKLDLQNQVVLNKKVLIMSISYFLISIFTQ